MFSEPTLLKKFQRYVSERSLCTQADKILLTVSGGVDSMVMLSLFAQSGYNVGVAHCNFCLRGSESDEDEVLVAHEAARYGVPAYNQRFDTQTEVDTSGDSVQMVARRLRYAWFEQLCTEHGYTHIAIAHHADDSVETFIINLLRGTGLRGLTGISVVNGRIIRPMLFSTRREILDYAMQQKIHYREDSSNTSTKYLRNKIRLGIIPRIKEIAPQFAEGMSANVERLTQAQEFVDRGIDRIREQAFTQQGGDLILDTEKIDPLLPRQFVIFELLNGYGFRAEMVEQICNALRNNHTGTRFFAKDRVAYVDRRRIIISPIAHEDTCDLQAELSTRRLYCNGCAIHFEHLNVDDVDALHQPDTVALLDEQKLTYPLQVRRWIEGDTFIPFGMSGHKKVSDLLIDAKVSMPDKRRQMVVLSAGQIVWVVGRRVDDRYAVGSSTENVLRLTREIE